MHRQPRPVRDAQTGERVYYEQRHHHRQRHHGYLMNNVWHPLARREDDDEREQVQGERYHPKQRDGRYVGRREGRDPEHEARRNERQPYPTQPPPDRKPLREPWGERRVDGLRGTA